MVTELQLELLASYDDNVVWSEHREELMGICRWSQANSASLIVVTLPQTNAVELTAPAAEEVGDLFESNDIPVVAMEDAMRDKDPLTLMANHVDAHPNEYLHGLIAERIAQIILEHDAGNRMAAVAKCR